MEYIKEGYINTIPGYWNNILIKDRDYYRTDFENSLENIVFKKEPEEKGGILGKLFSDKSKTLKSTIKALFNELKLREELGSFLLYKITQDICSEQSYLDNLQNLTRYNYPYEFSTYLSRTKMQLENNVLDLEKEKRKEYLECWKDLMFLRKYLMSALKDYWELSRKKGILAYDFTREENEDKGY